MIRYSFEDREEYFDLMRQKLRVFQQLGQKVEENKILPEKNGEMKMTYKELDILPVMDRLKILQKFKEINRESQKSAEEKQEKEIFLNKKIHKIMKENNFLNIGFCVNGKITDEYKSEEHLA
jgi:hypothetical protein